MAFDRTDPADLLALKNEINNDPNGYGYVSSDTNDVLTKINLVRNAITIQNSMVEKADVVSATLFGAYNALTADEQSWLQWITQTAGDELSVSSDLRIHLLGEGGNSIWAVGDRPTMEAAMLAIFDRDGSRAEELFGENTVITRDDWLAARDA